MDFDIEKAIDDPAKFFTKPEDVLEKSELTTEQKVMILKRWRFDLLDRLVAEEENMISYSKGPEVQLEDVIKALNKLHAPPDVRHSSPTKHGMT